MEVCPLGKYCCEMMTFQIEFQCNVHSNIFECPDKIISYDLKFDEYSIIIHDSGESTIDIGYCPWCGTKLPNPKRDLWFDELEKLGYDDPVEQDIPVEFNSDIWYKKRNF